MELKPIALQLYTVRDHLKTPADFRATLKRVAEIGYAGIEGGSGEAAAHGMSLEGYREFAGELGLSFSSGPGLRDDCGNADEVVEAARTLGVDCVWAGYGPDRFKTAEEVRKTAGVLNRMTEALAGTGLRVTMHNHFWEFSEVGGVLPQDEIARLCPDVCFELDIFWAANFGALDPAAQVAKYRSRTPLLHVKDGPLTREADGSVFMSAAGDGNVDIAACVAAADPKVLQWLVVEIDRCRGDMMEAVERSFRYLVGSGLGKGQG